jgi:hypothetical protein
MITNGTPVTGADHAATGEVPSITTPRTDAIGFHANE